MQRRGEVKRAPKEIVIRTTLDPATRTRKPREFEGKRELINPNMKRRMSPEELALIKQLNDLREAQESQQSEKEAVA